MKRGENGEDYFSYDLYDIKIADFTEKDDSFKKENDTVTFKNVNISKTYGHYSFAGSSVILVMNDTIRFLTLKSFSILNFKGTITTSVFIT